MHGVWDAMDLAGNAEDCASPPENYKPCNLASAPLRLGHGLSPLHCAMQPRLRSASARSRAVAPTLRHATSPPLRFGSVTGCRPIKSKIPTISCVSKLPPKWREFYFCMFHHPSHATSPPLRFGSVTGCRPIKKLKNKFSYVSELPTKFVFTFFAWLVVFVKKVLALWKKVW